ncbi:MAG: hypothetical protein V3T88_04820 [Nitrosomonadaceae bacterium]
MSADPNRLLFIISARGSISWKQYCEALDFLLELSSVKWQKVVGNVMRSYILQSLQALGHCDVNYSDAGSIICITPPTLCRLPRAGLPRAVLTGARSLDTRRHIKEAVKAAGKKVRYWVLRHSDRLCLLPDTIVVESESEEAMAKFCSDLRIAYTGVPSAWTLVNWCSDLTEIEETLNYRHPSTLNWPRYDFRPQVLDFVRTRSSTLPRFTRYRNPTTGLPLHVFFRDEHGAEVDLSWGRYLFLYSIGLNLACYDEKRFRLCVPLKNPFPALIARAVCLCSGQPPEYLSRTGLVSGTPCEDWLMYKQVPPQIAKEALTKVGQVPAFDDIHE